jgi:transposase
MEDHWTLDPIGRVIFDQFGVRYHPTSVRQLLHRMDWSSQKTQRTGLPRNDEAVANWKEKAWPRTKK